MLAYLVNSASRRRLLELLWLHQVAGSASDLARRARVGFATAYRELKRMEQFSLVSTRVLDGREEYAANTNHPAADLLRRLVANKPTKVAPSDADAIRTRRRLRALGAPLAVSPLRVGNDDREQALVDGVRLAHRDATLARLFPVVPWEQWKHVDQKRLKETARRAREKHALGFFAALTGQLSGDRALEQWAQGLRDHRVSALRPFFELPSVASTRELTERRTPKVAREWGFLMDLDYDSFRSAFVKSSKSDRR
jgi:hypothetical protein